ncbi:MAG: NAD-dependent epimerase/dehydratase family protein [Gammaproteobacteria bacterium]|nr:NAD-dependent epimerase/dehydratase family protein [Gammaproteobacteria bacterium]
MKDKVILAGCGYLGEYIGDMLLKKRCDLSIIKVCRSVKREQFSIKNIIRDFDKEEIDLQFINNSTVIYMAPPSTISDKDDRISNFINNSKGLNINKMIYISTSGVYGDCGGKLVDEDKKVSPMTKRAKRRVSAEKQLIDYSIENNIKLIILRVPGIYGKGRLPLKRVKEREALVNKDESRTTNIIHVEDLARICTASIFLDKNMEIINVSDGNPIKTTTYYEHVYKATDTKLPKYITYKEAMNIYSEKRLSFLKESRILDVEKMKRIFPGCIKHLDSYKGIRQCLDL